jgi:hypothetical protein
VVPFLSTRAILSCDKVFLLLFYGLGFKKISTCYLVDVGFDIAGFYFFIGFYLQVFLIFLVFSALIKAAKQVCLYSGIKRF